MDRILPDRAPASLASGLAGQVAAPGVTLCADDVPDGIVVADQAGRIVVFNQAAARLTGIAALSALGRDIRQVLPLRDAEGRSWWACTDPYHGLSTRSRHPERPLHLPDGTEFLVTMGYVRVPRSRRPGRAGRPSRAQCSASRCACAARSRGSASSAAAPTWSPPSPTSCVPR